MEMSIILLTVTHDVRNGRQTSLMCNTELSGIKRSLSLYNPQVVRTILDQL